MIAGYRLVRLVGSGGMGKVYAAQHPRLPRQDAVKILSPAFSGDPVFRARFEREAQLAAGLEHPNIVPVYDCGDDGGRLWLSMRLIDGPTAAALLRRSPAGLPAEEVVSICLAIAHALDFAHSRQLLHRDVKPENILIETRNEIPHVSISDFGVARIVGDESLTAAGMVFGTVDYCSPEQINGAPCDGRSDQYSLACTAAHLLTGVKPFAAATPSAVMIGHVQGERPAITAARPDLPGQVDAVFARALAVDPDQRYASCTEFVSALEHSLRRAPQPSADPRGNDAHPFSAPTQQAIALPGYRPPANAPAGPRPPGAPPYPPPSGTGPGGAWRPAPGPPPRRGRVAVIAAAAVVVVLALVGGVIGYTRWSSGSGPAPATDVVAVESPASTPSSVSVAPTPVRQKYSILDSARGALDPCRLPTELLTAGGMQTPMKALPPNAEIMLCDGAFTGNEPPILMGGYVAGSETARWVIEQYDRGTPAFDDLPGWRRYDATDREAPITRCKYGFVSETTPRYAFEVTVVRSPAREGFDARARAAACNRLAAVARAIDPAMPQPK